jgi:hypothetical protein
MQMIPVALATSGFEAKLLAARLGSEGVVWELRGDVDGLYPVGGIEILVPADEAERARDVLATEVDEPGDAGELDEREQRDDLDDPEVGSSATLVAVHRRRQRVLGVTGLALVLAFLTVRLLAMG